MTKRAIGLGMLFALAICAASYFCDEVARLPGAGGGGGGLLPHLMPPIVFGVLILVTLVVNRGLGRWRLHARELALIIAMALAGCAVPFFGMVANMPAVAMLPHHYNRTHPGWRQNKVLELVPERLLADPSRDKETAVTGYISGMGSRPEGFAVSDVPWWAWRRTLLFWSPLIVTLALCSVALGLVMHRQWVHHESLPYPITQLFGRLLPSEEGKGHPILSSGLFRWSAALVFLVLSYNYAAKFFPNILISVPLNFNFSPLIPLARPIQSGGGILFHPRIMFAVIGISYFFRKEVSISVGLTPFFVCYLMGVLIGYGVVAPGFNLMDNSRVFVHAGGYCGVFLMFLYTGRHYYWRLLKRSFGVRPPGDPGKTLDADQQEGVWAMRAFLVLGVLFVIQLRFIGVPIYMGLSFLAITMIVFAVVSRTVAETGVFLIGTWILPAAMIVGFLGDRVLGPSMYATLIVLSAVLVSGPGWAPLPFCAQALHLTDKVGIRPGKTVALLATVLVLGTAVAVPCTVYWHYVSPPQHGFTRILARWPFEYGLSMQRRMQSQGVLETVESASPLSRLRWLAPKRSYVIAFFITLGLACLVCFMQTRYARWPIHPIVFVFLGSGQAQVLAWSLLIGGLFKAGVVKFGGTRAYDKLKPLMIGLVAGDVLSSLLKLVVQVVRYWYFGHA